MNISNRKLAVAIFVTMLVSVAVAVSVQSALIYFHKDPRVVANVYFYEGTGANAVLIGESGNLITDLGENRTLLALNGTATTLCGIALGNCSSIAQTATGLDTEAVTASSAGFGRVQCNYTAAWMNSNDYSINYTASFDYTGAAGTYCSVNSAVLCWSTTPSAADAYALSFLTDGTQHQFPSSSPYSRITVIWCLTVNAN